MKVVGLMSGTSADGIDAALVEVEGAPLVGQVSDLPLRVRLLHYLAVPYEAALREEIFACFRPQTGTVERICRLNFALGEAFAAAALRCIAAAGLSPADVHLIGSHGQTIYHAVDASSPVKSTLQIGEAAVIAHHTGITTVADFRVADVAAGGQGAPLVSYVDWLLFRHRQRRRAVQNIGGIANVTYLPPKSQIANRKSPIPVLDEPLAFDTGPGNMLIDYAAGRATEGAWPCDRDGALAAQGKVDERLLAELMAHPYLQLPPPKTTGREQFGVQFGAEVWERAKALVLRDEDIVATLTAFTAASIADAYRRFLPQMPDEVILGGGGARNPTLRAMLRERLAPARLLTHEDLGFSSQAKEALAFAVLAYEAIHGRPGNLPSCTGASRRVVLGKIVPGENYTNVMRAVQSCENGRRDQATFGLDLAVQAEQAEQLPTNYRQTIYVLGVDGGATKTTAVVLDEEAGERGRGQGGPSNIHVVGRQAAKAALAEAIGGALQAAGLTAEGIAAVGLGMAGIGRPTDRAAIEQMVREIGPFPRLVVAHDAETALVGGVGRRHGLVVIAGTGSIAYGVNARGEARRAGGWGYRLGDEGSGYWIGREALRALIRASDGRGPATQLEKWLLAHLGLASPEELIPLVYDGGLSTPDMAALTPLVVQTAAEGDAIARAILRQAGRELAQVAAAVIRGLGMEEESFEAVLTGGVLQSSEIVRQTLVQLLRAMAPNAQPIAPRRDAAVGAALLALSPGPGSRGAEEQRREDVLSPAPQLLRSSAQERSLTEARNPATMDIDSLPTAEIVALINAEEAGVAQAVQQELPAIVQAVERIVERLRRGGRLLYCGAGTSGRLGVLDAAEMVPTFGTEPEMVQAFIAGGQKAITEAIEGAEDDHQAGAEAMHQAGVREADVVVGIAASGRTPWVLGALAEARRRGALTIGLACTRHSLLEELAEVTIAPLVGPEVIAGSTRLKAGTAQKMVLNMLSTATMIRLSKVYGNLMVDVRPTSDKLRERARRILQEAAGVGPEAAEQALEVAGYQVKVALVMLLAGVGAEEARRRLGQAAGDVRRALAEEM